MAPVTTAGRAITIIYAVIGIPLCLVVLASVGKVLTRAIKYVWMFVRRFYYTGSCRRVRRMIPVSRLRMTPLQLVRRLRRSTRRLHREIRRRSVIKPAEEQEEEDSGQQSEEESSVPYEVDDTFNLPPSVALIVGVTYTLLGALMYMSKENFTYFEAFYFTCISLCTIGFGDVVPSNSEFFVSSCVYLIIGLALLAMIINVFMVAMRVTITKATNRVMEVGQRLAERDESEVVEPEIIVPETYRTCRRHESAKLPSCHHQSLPTVRRHSV